MRDHHLRAVEKARARLLGQSPGLLAVLLAGSIAKGIDRDTSDADLMVVVSPQDYSRRRAENRVGFLWRDVCDYEGGYVEGRFLGKDFLAAAAERGSEPTRHSFTGVKPLYCIDPEILDILPRIPIYPEHERQARIDTFRSQMELNRIYFFPEGIRRRDPYLQTRAACEIVLFGCRMVLAHNRQLFACQRRLMEQVAAVTEKPAGIVEKANRLLGELSQAAMDDFCETVLGFTDWGECDIESRWLLDSEMSWFTGACAAQEW